MKIHVTLDDANGESQRHTLSDEGQLTFGRGSKADVRVVAAGVSRIHCRIEGDGDRFWLVDLDSRHGTFVNDGRVTRYLLYDGDFIKIGSAELDVRIEGDLPTSPGETMPEVEESSPDIAAADAVARADPWHQGLTGQIVGSYQLLERLGRNEFVAVYRSRQLNVRRPVAFKVLARPIAEDDECVARLLGASGEAGKLKHRHVVHTYDVGHEDEMAFLVTEFVAGRTLKGVLTSERRRAKLTPSRAAKIATHVARALHHAHDHGVLHRTITPKHIMLGQDGRAKLADFGLAACLERFARKSIAERGARMGMLCYLAPEQIDEQDDVDERTDIYALGAVLYHMLTGSPPFANDAEALEAIGRDTPVPPTDVNPDIPASLSDLAMRALSKDPDDRPRSADKLLAALREA